MITFRFKKKKHIEFKDIVEAKISHQKLTVMLFSPKPTMTLECTVVGISSLLEGTLNRIFLSHPHSKPRKKIKQEAKADE